jgi:hypothetical protein
MHLSYTEKPEDRNFHGVITFNLHVQWPFFSTPEFSTFELSVHRNVWVVRHLLESSYDVCQCISKFPCLQTRLAPECRRSYAEQAEEHLLLIGCWCFLKSVTYNSNGCFSEGHDWTTGLALKSEALTWLIVKSSYLCMDCSGSVILTWIWNILSSDIQVFVLTNSDGVLIFHFFWNFWAKVWTWPLTSSSNSVEVHWLSIIGFSTGDRNIAQALQWTQRKS